MRARTVPPVRRVVRRAAAQRNARRAVCFRGATCFRLCRAPARVPLPDGRRGAGSARASRPSRCGVLLHNGTHVVPCVPVARRAFGCAAPLRVFRAGREARCGVGPCLPSVAWCGVLLHNGTHVAPCVPVARRAFGCAPAPRAPRTRTARRAPRPRSRAPRAARRDPQPRRAPRATAPRSRAAARGAASARSAARPAVRARRRRRPPPPRGRPRRPPCRRARRSGRRPAHDRPAHGLAAEQHEHVERHHPASDRDVRRQLHERVRRRHEQQL